MSSRKKQTIYSFAIRVAICLSVVSFIVYVYIDQRNHLTELRRVIPQLEKEVKRVHEENVSLRYEMNRFRDPRHLLELARQPQYRHLRFPSSEEVIVIEERRGGVEQ
jgi:cell division protein FtsB